MKITETIKQLPMNFMKCGVAGWCSEVIFTSMESLMAHDLRLFGRTSLLMFPIYGMGVLLRPTGSFVDHMIDGKDNQAGCTPKDRLIRHGFLYMVLIFTAEYLSGAFLRARGICPWDYSQSRMNVNGLIRLDFAPLWFLLGLFMENITGMCYTEKQ